METKSISDNEILELLQSGKLCLSDCGEYIVNHRGQRKYVELVERRGYYTLSFGISRYTFRIQYQGKRRRIVRSKLVWFAHNGQLIPEGYFIHHVDGNRLNDSIDNLQLVSCEEHYDIHYGEF